VVAAVLALAGSVLVTASVPADSDAPGSTSGGDPYFPAAGNGGYDVGHYGLDLAYEPATGRLDGTATITLATTADLDTFSLDLRGLAATSVGVDGRPATFDQLPPDATGRVRGELVVRVPRLEARTTHVVTVVYGGVPGRPRDMEGEPYGFVTFRDGAFVANEPEGASTWYPVNDVPTGSPLAIAAFPAGTVMRKS